VAEAPTKEPMAVLVLRSSLQFHEDQVRDDLITMEGHIQSLARKVEQTRNALHEDQPALRLAAVRFSLVQIIELLTTAEIAMGSIQATRSAIKVIKENSDA